MSHHSVQPSEKVDYPLDAPWVLRSILPLVHLQLFLLVHFLSSYTIREWKDFIVNGKWFPKSTMDFQIQDTTLHSLPLCHQWHLLPGLFQLRFHLSQHHLQMEFFGALPTKVYLQENGWIIWRVASLVPGCFGEPTWLVPSCIDGQCSSEALAQVEEYRMTFCGKSHLAMGSWQKMPKAVITEIFLSKLYLFHQSKLKQCPFWQGNLLKIRDLTAEITLIHLMWSSKKQGIKIKCKLYITIIASHCQGQGDHLYTQKRITCTQGSLVHIEPHLYTYRNKNLRSLVHTQNLNHHTSTTHTNV